MNELHRWSSGSQIADLAILIVIIAAIVGLVIVALRVFEVSIPAWVVKVFWIIVVALVVIWAIRLVASM